MSLGAEFRGWGTTIGEEVDRISEARALLREINLGATAIGTSVTAAHGYPNLAVSHLSALTGVEFILAGDLVEATSDTGAYVQLSGVLKRTAKPVTASAGRTHDAHLPGFGHGVDHVRILQEPRLESACGLPRRRFRNEGALARDAGDCCRRALREHAA